MSFPGGGISAYEDSRRGLELGIPFWLFIQALDFITFLPTREAQGADLKGLKNFLAN